VEKKTSEYEYVISTPDRQKTKRLCHMNMLKPYHSKDSPVSCKVVTTVTPVMPPESETVSEEVVQSMKLQNSDVLTNLDVKLSHLQAKEGVIKQLVEEFSDLFPDVPGRTIAACHDVVGTTHPVKQHPYRMNPTKLEALRQEVDCVMALLNRVIVNGAHHGFWFPNQTVPTDFALISGELML